MASKAQLTEMSEIFEEKNQNILKEEVKELNVETKFEHIVHEIQHEIQDIKEEIQNEIKHEISVFKSLRKDLTKILFLVYLYFLQGIPLGLSASIPLLLTSYSINYSDQGTFSFSGWPFSLKLLWAPIVDSIYYHKFGRRKSWLIPAQLLIGLFMVIFASNTKSLIESGQTKSDIIFLTSIFFILNFLASTQDICVDGWAISMLSKENVSWQSTCNNVGQAIGIFVSNTLFIILESKSFSNQYIRRILGLPSQEYGIINIQNFMIVFGIIFLVTTVLIIFLKNENGSSTLCFLFKKNNEYEVSKSEKKETDEDSFEHEKLNLIHTYKTMLWIFKLIPIRKLAFYLLTCKIAFTVNSVLFLKLIEAGVTKEVQTLLDVPITVLTILWAVLIGKYTNGNKSFIYNILTIGIKIIVTIIISVFVYFLSEFKNLSGEFQWYFYVIYSIITMIDKMVNTVLFITIVSFFAKISDENIGGTYMTLLATLSNLGSMYTNTAGMYLVNWFSVKKCSFDNLIFNGTFVNMTQLDLFNITYIAQSQTDYSSLLLQNNITAQDYVNKCSSSSYIKECTKVGGQCKTIIDAYYYLVGIFSAIGLVYVLAVYKSGKKINFLPKSEWKIKYN